MKVFRLSLKIDKGLQKLSKAPQTGAKLWQIYPLKVYIVLSVLLVSSCQNGQINPNGSINQATPPSKVEKFQLENYIIGKWVAEGGVKLQDIALIPKYELEFTPKKVYVSLDRIVFSSDFMSSSVKSEQYSSNYLVDGTKITIESTGEFYTLEKDSTLYNETITYNEKIKIRLKKVD